MPRIPVEEADRKIDNAIKGIVKDFESNHPMLKIEDIAEKYELSISCVSRRLIPILQKMNVLESKKRRAGFYYNPNYSNE